MKNEVYYHPRRTRNSTVRLGTKTDFGKMFKSQILVCLVLTVVLGGVSILPEGQFTKTKNAVKLILTQNTDIAEQIDKIKSTFITEENIEAMSPVAEFVSPAPYGVVTASFGVQDADNTGFHYGIDIKMEEKGNVLAAASGEVTQIATNEELGTHIIIRHSDEIFTTYAHLGEILPDVGEKVTAGKTIARVNDDDNTFYFEIRRNDTYLDPAEFIDFGEEE